MGDHALVIVAGEGAESANDTERLEEIVGRKGLALVVRERASGSFAALRMTARTSNSKGNRSCNDNDDGALFAGRECTFHLSR
jgi:hypothetical protein